MNCEIFKPTVVLVALIILTVLGLGMIQIQDKPSEKNAQVLRDFIEKHCRVYVMQGGVVATNELRKDGTITTGQIKCDQ